MFSRLHVLTKRSKLSLLVPLLLSLVACSSANNTTTNPLPSGDVPVDFVDSTAISENYPYVASVVVDSSMKRRDIELEYGGKVIMHKPKSGFALLAFRESSTSNSTALTVQSENTKPETFKREMNLDSVRNPAVSANGVNAWSSGVNAWSSGVNAWSSGVNAWSSGDAFPPPPLENQGIWNSIRLNQAYELSKNYGEGVTVAVIDTGLDLDHPIFIDRLTPKNTWRDYVDDDKTPQDLAGGASFGHGTGVAGIVAQLAPKADILPLRVLSSNGKGDVLSIVFAIDHAVTHGANIINLSLGTAEPSDALLNIIKYARDEGVYVVAAAGNNGNENQLDFPAQYAWWTQAHPYLMSVSSVDANNILSSFSAYGDQLVISAPGEQILSAYPDSSMAYFTGTSFSSPLLSGALALAYSDTTATYQGKLFDYVINSVCCGEIWEANRAQAGTDRIGHGILDIVNLLRELPTFSEPQTPKNPNLLTNPSFESALDTWENSNVNVINDTIHEGNSALKLGAGEAWIKQTLSQLEPNTTYSFSVWLKRSDSKNLVNMTVDSFDGTSAKRWLSVWTDNSDYVSRSINFTTGSDASGTNIGIWKNGADEEVFIDKLSLVKQSF